MKDDKPLRDRRSAALRIGAAFGIALAFAAAVYFLLEAVRPASGLVSFSFLLILPAAASAFVAYVADPWAERSLGGYLLVPVYLLLAVIAGSIWVLHEGVICILILSPLWLVSGLAGAGLTYRMRRRVEDGRLYCAGMLALPLLAMTIEPYVTVPDRSVAVTRSIIVEAPTDRLWPLLRGIPDVRPDEGRWNLSQDVIGLPRPLGARLIGKGVGARRIARWRAHVRFGEIIEQWRPGRILGWRFHFDEPDGWAFTDRHLMPDSAYFRVTTGGYRLDPVDGGRTRVTLTTRYWLRTPVNGYSQLWGEFFLGDIENNLLALVKQRAERGQSLTNVTKS